MKLVHVNMCVGVLHVPGAYVHTLCTPLKAEFLDELVLHEVVLRLQSLMQFYKWFLHVTCVASVLFETSCESV